MDNFLDVCPICYNPYDEPKGLPCFHTFCRECLQTYINKSSVNGLYFSCPMCRKRTEPFGEKSLPLHQWATSFPTNSYILNRYFEVSQKQCPTHNNEILDINCKTCRLMICSQCCLSTHEKCEKTMTKFNAKKIKNTLSTRLHKLKIALKPMEERLSTLEEEQDNTLSQIKEISQELLDYVSSQEKYWLNEIQTAYSKKSSGLQEQCENLVQIIEMVEENINELDNLFGKEDIVEGSKSCDTFDYQPKHAVMTTRTTDFIELKETEINFQINQNFVNLKDELLDKNIIEKPEDAALTEVAVMENKSRRLLKEVSLSSETFVGINDFIMLPDQCFLISEGCFKRVWRYSSTGERLQDLYFDSEPFGLCLLQDNRVAISQPYNRKINIFDCDNLIEKESFSFGKRYYGLGSDDNNRIFSLYRDQNMCVDIIAKSHPESAYNVSHVIKLPNTLYFCDDYRLRVLPSGHILIMNSARSMSVICIAQNGSVAFSYEGDEVNKFNSISDIAVDSNFIYVADKTTNLIHRLQHQGSFVDILLTASDGVHQSRKMYVNNEGVIAIFSKENRNYKVRLFSS